jgi:hypothetical protein
VKRRKSGALAKRTGGSNPVKGFSVTHYVVGLAAIMVGIVGAKTLAPKLGISGLTSFVEKV